MTKEELFELYERDEESQQNLCRHPDYVLCRKYGEALFCVDKIKRQLEEATAALEAAKNLWHARLDADEVLSALNTVHLERMTQLLRARSQYIAEHPEESKDESGWGAFFAWQEGESAA